MFFFSQKSLQRAHVHVHTHTHTRCHSLFSATQPEGRRHRDSHDTHANKVTMSVGRFRDKTCWDMAMLFADCCFVGNAKDDRRYALLKTTEMTVDDRRLLDNWNANCADPDTCVYLKNLKVCMTDFLLVDEHQFAGAFIGFERSFEPHETSTGASLERRDKTKKRNSLPGTDKSEKDNKAKKRKTIDAISKTASVTKRKDKRRSDSKQMVQTTVVHCQDKDRGCLFELREDTIAKKVVKRQPTSATRCKEVFEPCSFFTEFFSGFCQEKYKGTDTRMCRDFMALKTMFRSLFEVYKENAKTNTVTNVLILRLFDIVAMCNEKSRGTVCIDYKMLHCLKSDKDLWARMKNFSPVHQDVPVTLSDADTSRFFKLGMKNRRRVPEKLVTKQISLATSIQRKLRINF